VVDNLCFVDRFFAKIRRTDLRRAHATKTPEGAAMF
jgi:hypothetical protein